MYFREEGSDRINFSSKGPVTCGLDQLEPMHRNWMTYSRRCIGSINCNHVIILPVVAGLNKFFSSSVLEFLRNLSIATFLTCRTHTFKVRIVARLSHCFLACVIFPTNNAACEDMLDRRPPLRADAALLRSGPRKPPYMSLVMLLRLLWHNTEQILSTVPYELRA